MLLSLNNSVRERTKLLRTTATSISSPRWLGNGLSEASSSQLANVFTDAEGLPS
jgi:hypothetical protein